MLESGLNGFNGRAVPFDKVRRDNAALYPPTHMREQALWQRYWRLAFIGAALADRKSIEDAFVQVDKRVTDVAIRGRRSDGPGARAT
jgi:hypothetical protein